jgi:4'-phosphopantetheinyl transferase
VSTAHVDVWRASLHHDAQTLAALEPLLADDELTRADAFHFARDRRRYVAGRGILRTLLGSALDVAPEAVTLRYGEHGKPLLDGGQLWFNLAHSGDTALLAVSHDFEVGVDVELAQPPADRDAIAERFFSPAEVSDLRALAPSQRDAAFLRCWTRKEAFVKARGDGLTLALDAFDVSLAPGEPCELRRTAWSDAEPASWQLVDLSDPAGGFVAAVAAHARGWQVRMHEFLQIPVPVTSMRR